MIIRQIFRNHIDEQGLPKVQEVLVQSSVGVSPEEAGIQLHQWALSIRCQLNLVHRKLYKLEKETNYLLFNPKTK
jgi:hypothetical protein